MSLSEFSAIGVSRWLPHVSWGPLAYAARAGASSSSRGSVDLSLWMCCVGILLVLS